VTQWPDQDEAFLDVTKAIRAAVEAIAPPRASSPSPPQTVTAAAVHMSPGPRSSNLRLHKEFTQADRDRFVDEAFTYMRLFFENSLQELRTRHAGIDTAFRSIDANRFTAVVYRDGKTAAQCLIRLEHSHRSSSEIQFSHSMDSREHTYNESLHVEHDDQGLFLKALGMPLRQAADPKLTLPGSGRVFLVASDWALTALKLLSSIEENEVGR